MVCERYGLYTTADAGGVVPFEFDETKSRANKAKHGLDFHEG
jgi:hypothetical protein